MYKKDNKLQMKTIGECLAQRVLQTPDAIAVEFEGDTLTWSQLDRLSDWLVLRFNQLGMKRDSRAAVWCENCMQWVIVYLGLQKIGALTILVNPGYQTEELYNVIEYAKVEYLFYGESYKEMNLPDIIDHMDLKRYPFLKQTIPIELEDAIRFMEVGAAKMDQNAFIVVNHLKENIQAEDIACMLFTSGTTSVSKGVMLSHYNIVNCAYATVDAMHWTLEDKMCVMVPLFHCFGMTSSLISSVLTGACLYLMRRYRTVHALQAIQEHGCTILNGVPSMFLAMIHNKEFDQYDLTNLKSGIIAGSKITPEEYRIICDKLHIGHLHMSYGQTETSPGVSFSGFDLKNNEKSDNAGYMVDHIELCIWDQEGKQYIYSTEQLQKSKGVILPLESNETPYRISGEIGIRGFLVMQGYYNMPEETAKTLQKDGWLHTGDVGYLDEKKQLHVESRLKEMIIRGGENIYPGEIEECILEIEGIKQVKVVGIPHKILQEEIAAAVVLQPSIHINEQVIREYVRNHLAHYKAPSVIKFMDKLPTTASGKLAIGQIQQELKTNL